jgi:hypothetical protein
MCISNFGAVVTDGAAVGAAAATCADTCRDVGVGGAAAGTAAGTAAGAAAGVAAAACSERAVNMGGAAGRIGNAVNTGAHAVVVGGAAVGTAAAPWADTCRAVGVSGAAVRRNLGGTLSRAMACSEAVLVTGLMMMDIDFAARSWSKVKLPRLRFKSACKAKALSLVTIVPPLHARLAVGVRASALTLSVTRTAS